MVFSSQFPSHVSSLQIITEGSVLTHIHDALKFMIEQLLTGMNKFLKIQTEAAQQDRKHVSHVTEQNSVLSEEYQKGKG